MLNKQKIIARAGFSLMEIMIALAILGFIMAMVGPALQKTLARGKAKTAKNTMMSFKNGIMQYKMDVGQLPSSLKDLIQKPRDERASKKWDGPYIEKSSGDEYEELPEDPYNNPFVYKLTPNAKHPYELYSRGPKGPDAPKEEWISVWDE
jgi:general secretion pathway protein G